MAELITITSSKHGLGKTTYTALITTVLAEKGKKCLVLSNSNNTDLAEIFMVDSELNSSDLKPYILSGMLDKDLIAGVTSQVNKDIHIISNSVYQDTELDLNSEDIFKIFDIISKDYDYVLSDLDFELEKDKGIVELLKKADKNIIITSDSKLNSRRAELQLNSLDKEDRVEIKKVVDKSLIIFNMTENDIELNVRSFRRNEEEGRVVYIKYLEGVSKFSNGFKLDIPKEYEKQIENITKFIMEGIEEEDGKKSILKKLFKRR